MNPHSTKDGRNFIIRTPDTGDAESIITYAKQLFASTDQTLTTLEEYTITVDQEKDWISIMAQTPNALILIAEMENRVVGLLDFNARPKKKSAHTGEFGVSAHPSYQGIGIGRALINTLLNWAKQTHAIEKVFLNVFHTNPKAIALYKQLGFVEEGRHIKAVKQPTGDYVDVIQMYIETK